MNESSQGIRKEEIFNMLIQEIEELLQLNREKDLRERPKIELKTDIFDDLGIDSVELMELVSAVERRFNISTDIEKLAEKRKVGEIVDYICSQVPNDKKGKQAE